MNKLTDQQISFLTTYLGLAPQEPPGETVAADLDDHNLIVPMWQKAKDTVDAQLRRLSDVLRVSGDPDLEEVTNEVADLLKPVRVSLVGPLMEFDGAPSVKTVRDGALEAIGTARKWIDSDPRIAAVDENP